MEGYALSLNVRYKYSWVGMPMWDDGSQPYGKLLGHWWEGEVSWKPGGEILAAEHETQTAPSGGLQEQLWGI